MAVEETKNNDEAAIQRLLDDAIRALHDKNIEGIMSIYAPEVVRPLRRAGRGHDPVRPVGLQQLDHPAPEAPTGSGHQQQIGRAHV